MGVTTQHPQYIKNVGSWLKTRAAVDGYPEELYRYLRVVDKDDPDRQRNYQDGAVYQNWTTRTKDFLLGAVFRKPFEVELPPALEYLKQEADQAGNTLDQFARSVVGHTIQFGRHSILVDFPHTGGAMSRAQERANNVRPYLVEYDAFSLTNWKEEDGKEVLAVLKECRLSDSITDKYEHLYEDQYRVLEIDENGLYVQRLVDTSDDDIEDPREPKFGGKRPNYLPLFIAGSLNNDICVDPSPLKPIADLNIAAFRNSADYEESVHLVSQAMLQIDTGNMDAATWDKMNPGGIRFGSSAAVITTGGGSASLIQAASNSMAFEALTNKAQQAVQIGSKLVERSGGNETAEAARIDSAAETSALDLIVGNCSVAIESALKTAAEIAGENPDSVTFKLNREFFAESIDPQMMAQAMGLFDRAVILKEELRGTAVKAGIANPDIDNVEAFDRISQEVTI